MAEAEMELEIEAPDHSKIALISGCKTEIGRAFTSGDLTVSRRHALLEPSAADTETTGARACFEVAGKNPVWVRRGKDGKIEVFRKSEKGKVAYGDAICLSGKSPAWFLVKRSGNDAFEGDRDSVTESGTKRQIAVENIDPVAEFGFLVPGHEFDQYPKHKIRDVNNWDWFLDESEKESSEDDEVDKRSRRKKRKTVDNKENDDDWMGESEEDKEVVLKARKVQRPTYATRSADHRSRNDKQKSGSYVQKRCVQEEREDEDDETLGGFIAEDDDDDTENESGDLDEEEEEEFDDEDDND